MNTNMRNRKAKKNNKLPIISFMVCLL